MWDEIGLPFLDPLGKDTIESIKRRYTGVSDRGVIKHKKQTVIKNLLRTITEGNYYSRDPQIIYQKPYYRSPRDCPKEEYDAVIIQMRDISISIDEKRRQLITTANHWQEQIIRVIHQNIDSRYIIHAVKAEETDQETFNTAEKGGGTVISSAFEKCIEVIENYPYETNFYPFYYSDGDNIPDDYNRCHEYLKEISRLSNMFCYGQCENKFTNRREYPGLFHYMQEWFEDDENNSRIRLAKFNKKSDIIPMLKVFLNKDDIPFYKAGG